MTKPWVCYLIASLDSNETYVGSTNDQPKRLYNHNRAGNYGAKRTRGRTWIPIVTLSGFPNKNSCLSFESGWKRLSKRRANNRFYPINCLADTNLRYEANTKWNRIMDLIYFVHNFTFIENKFKINYDLRHRVRMPHRLTLNIFMEDWIGLLPWPFFVVPREVR